MKTQNKPLLRCVTLKEGVLKEGVLKESERRWNYPNSGSYCYFWYQVYQSYECVGGKLIWSPTKLIGKKRNNRGEAIYDAMKISKRCHIPYFSDIENGTLVSETLGKVLE